MANQGFRYILDSIERTPTTGGYTNCVFSLTEKRLVDSSDSDDYMVSVLALADLSVMNNYESLMDYIFCETWLLPWKGKARLFYDRKGPALIADVDLVSRELLWYDVMMSRVILDICRRSWSKDDGASTWTGVLTKMRSTLRGQNIRVRGRPHFKKVGGK